jgi:hypothetical protein
MQTTVTDDLLAALRALMALDVKGHALADRLQFSDAGRALLNQCRAAIARATTEDKAYNARRIGWELERTAMGDSYYGNALRVAMDIPCVTDEDRAVLQRYATGAQRVPDQWRLQDIAEKVYFSKEV